MSTLPLSVSQLASVRTAIDAELPPGSYNGRLIALYAINEHFSARPGFRTYDLHELASPEKGDVLKALQKARIALGSTGAVSTSEACNKALDAAREALKGMFGGAA